MCTVTWAREEDGYHLLCNRDEKLTRLPARPPCLEAIDGVNVIAPRDANFDGAWIGVNERGVALCLLNGARIASTERRPIAAVESRGKAVLRLASSRRVEEVFERALRLDFSAFAPFTMVAMEPGRSASLIEWNGDGKTILPDGDGLMPLVSSSFDPEGVRASRRARFERMAGKDAGALYRFHESHGAQPSPYSTCMHRADAATVSFSWVTVTRAAVDFFYVPGPPCQLMPGTHTQLARAR